MALFDWVCAGVLLASMLLGFLRGLVFEVLAVLGWVSAFLLAQWLAPEVAPRLPIGQALQGTMRYASGFLVVFVMAVFVFGFIAGVARKLTEAAGLRPADRALGALFGALRALVLLLAVTVVVTLASLHQSVWWQESKMGPWLALALAELAPALPHELGKYLPP